MTHHTKMRLVKRDCFSLLGYETWVSLGRKTSCLLETQIGGEVRG